VGARDLVWMRGQLDARVQLQKTVAGKQLAVCAERFEHRRLTARASLGTSCRRNQLSSEADDGTRVEAVKQFLLVAEREIPERRTPVLSVVGELVRNLHF